MSDRPNILIVMPDQMTAGVTAIGRACRMANVQRLAEHGIRFSRTYTVAPHCCPARASFFTGHLPSRHGIWNNIDGPTAFGRSLPPGMVTLGELLGAAGYRLAFSGKWHVSKTQSPASLGWTMPEPADPPALPRHPVAPLPDTEESPAAGLPVRDMTQDPSGELPRPGWGGQKRIFETLPPSHGQGMHGWSAVQAGVRAIREFSSSSRQGPWCVFVSPDPPHDPYRAPANYVDFYRAGAVELPPSFADELLDKPRVVHRQRRQLWDRMGRDGAAECLRHYYAACSLVDDWLGILLDELDATGQADNTLVLFTSDHGDYAGAHGLWCKGIASFSEAYGVPGIARWPAGIAAPGREVDELVSITDFMPTFLELADLPARDAPASGGMYGRSLTPFFAGRHPEGWRDVLISQYNGAELYYSQRGVWDRDWKYVFNGFDYDELYDLRNDPHEMVNLADPSACPHGRQPSQAARTGGSAYGLGRGKPGSRGEQPAALPPLPPELDGVRRRLLRRLWQVMAEHGDRYVSNGYWPMGLAPYGPGLADT